MVIFLLTSRATHAQDDAFYVRKDLHLDWVYYDEDEEVMLPFLETSGDQPRAIHLHLKPGYGKNAFLKIKIPSNTSLFIDNRLIDYLPDDTLAYFSADSLAKRFGNEEFVITLFNKNGFQKPVEALIGFKRKITDELVEVNPVRARKIDQKIDYIKIIVLTIFIIFVMIYTLAQAELFDFYDIRWLFTFRYTDTIIMKYRNFTKQQLVVVIFYSSLLSGLFLVFLHYHPSSLTGGLMFNINLLLEWLMITGIIVGLIFLKFVLVWAMSWLFKITDRVNIYMIEFLRSGIIFFSVIFIIVSFTLINYPGSLTNLMEKIIYFAIAFYFLRFLLLFFKFHQNTSIKNLHLFSYLCATELIPMIIGINYFLK